MSEQAVKKEENRSYSEGMWIVHANYGVGQIIRYEEKQLGGKNRSYYRVEGDNATFWFSPDRAGSTKRVRPVATRGKLKEAIKVMAERPQKLAPTHKERVTQIQKIVSTGSLIPIAGLIRDLSYQAVERKLSNPEQETLENLQKRLVKEWSVVFDVKPEEAQTKINESLTYSIE